MMIGVGTLSAVAWAAQCLEGKPYFIVGLPRSRTAWLANFLTNGYSCCHHELLRECESVEEFSDKLHSTRSLYVGDSDSGIPLFFPKINEAFPNAKYVFIDRDIMECKYSYARAFPNIGRHEAEKTLSAVAKNIALMRLQIPDERKFTVNFYGLDNNDVCERIWNFCVPGSACDRQRLEMLQKLHVEMIWNKVEASVDPKKISKLKGQLWAS